MSVRGWRGANRKSATPGKAATSASPPVSTVAASPGSLGHPRGGVVVDAQPVGGAADQVQVAGTHQLGVRQHRRDPQGPGVVLAVDQRAQPHPVADRVDAVGRRGRARSVSGSTGVRFSTMPTLSAPASCMRAAASPWPSSRWCAARWASRADLLARRVPPGGVAEVGRAPGLVMRRPDAHPVTEPVVDRGRVVGEVLGGVAHQPAAAVLQRLRQVPVVQRGHRLDPALEETVDQALVVVQPALLHVAAAVGQDPRPGDREAVVRDTEAGDQVDVGPGVGVGARTRPSRPRRRRRRRERA